MADTRGIILTDEPKAATPPVPDGVKPAGLNELNGLMQRMKIAHDKMSATNANRALLVECSQWLRMLSARVMTLQAKYAAQESSIVRPF